MRLDQNEWNRWAASYKICYYPYFLYTLPQYDVEAYNKHHVEDEIRLHIKKIKTYLLYFDYVTVPISTLIKPLNNYSKDIFEGLVQNKDFIDLIEQKLVISTVYKGEDIHTTFEKRLDYLKEIAWDVQTTLYQDFLKHELSSFLLYENEVKTQVNLVRDETFKKAEKASIKYKEQLFELIKLAEKNSKFPFSHEKFSKLVFDSNDKALIEFLRSTNIDYFEGSELGNPGSVMPFIGSTDHVQRKSINTQVYSFLYGSKFFEGYISNFLDAGLLANISDLSGTDLQEFRRLDLWQKFIDYYYTQVKELSEKLHKTPAEDIESKAMRLIQLKSKSKKLFYLIEALITALSYLPPIKHLVRNETVKEAIRRAQSLAYLKVKYPGVYDYMLFLEGKLKSKETSK